MHVHCHEKTYYPACWVSLARAGAKKELAPGFATVSGQAMPWPVSRPVAAFDLSRTNPIFALAHVAASLATPPSFATHAQPMQHAWLHNHAWLHRAPSSIAASLDSDGALVLTQFQGRTREKMSRVQVGYWGHHHWAEQEHKQSDI